MVSSNILSWEYITVILDFCNHCIFFFFTLTSTEKWRNLKFLVGENSIGRTLKDSVTPIQAYVLKRHKKFKEGHGEEMKDESKSKRLLTSRTKVRQVVGVWWLWVDHLNDCKSAIHEKGQWLEVYHQRFGHVWKVIGLDVLNIWQFLAERNIVRLEQPSYSPNFASCDFLFPKLKGIIKGTCFEGNEVIKRACNDGVEGHPWRILLAVHRSMTEKVH